MRANGVLFTKDPRLESKRAVFGKILPYLPDSLLLWVCYEITLYLTSTKKNDWDSAISICKQEMDKCPKNIMLSILLNKLYFIKLAAGKSNYNNVIETERLFFATHAEIDLFALESILFAFYWWILPWDTRYLDEILSLL